MAATTLPTLLLGGEPAAIPRRRFESWEKALRCPPCTAWSSAGTLLYPPDDDVAGAVDMAVGLVRG